MRRATVFAIGVLLFCAAAASLMVNGTALAVFGPQAPAKPCSRTLTFTQLVAYQRAIEEVYWRHRIWPKENRSPKPSLDAVMSQAQLEKKVEDYLRKSQLVAEQRGWPITGSELQAEMERMATHTLHPRVLLELFQALDNDPFVIAECLARPLVAERLASELTGHSGVEALENPAVASHPLRVPNVKVLTAATASTSQSYKLPQISVPLDCTDDTWTATNSTSAPDARRGHTAVWTGSEMIIWGGYNGLANLNNGARYDPATDSWVTTTLTNAPSARWRHRAVWTGAEMIIWGGSTGNNRFNSGGRYDPAGDSWMATSTANAPSARFFHNALWDGSEMIVWGGSDSTNYLHTGGRYDPSTDSWIPTGLVNVPLGRTAHTATWTGGEMIVWGGVDETFNDTNSGGRYNPIADSWTATSLGNAPSPRDSHAAVWTRSEMIVWGGIFNTTNLNTGGRYNAVTDSWIPTTTANAPFSRYDHTAVWTGTEMIVWGGLHYPSPFLNTGGRYCAQSGATPTPTPTATTTPTATPTATPTHRPTPIPRLRPSPAPRP